jgi:galactokinase
MPTLQPLGMNDPNPEAKGWALLADAAYLHESTFSEEASHGAFAPGRVNLIGEHIDYSGGFVLPIAINRGTIAVGRATEEPTISVVSTANPETVVTVPMGGSPVVSGWAAYIVGAVAVLDQMGLAPRQGCTIAVASEVPLGAGLSSSAALEVATVLCALGIAGKSLSMAQVAAAARKAEHDFAKVPCGIMDQYISAMGLKDHALLIDCFHSSHRAVPIPRQAALVIADSGVKHELAGGEYAKRRAACERALAAANAGRAQPLQSLRHASAGDFARVTLDDEEARCVRHALGECKRTRDFAAAIAKGDLVTCGALMNASHESLRADYRVSVPELDRLAESAREFPGAFGARMTGGGFGGCIVALTTATRAEAMVDYLLRTKAATQAFATPACQGARSLTFNTNPHILH